MSSCVSASPRRSTGLLLCLVRLAGGDGDRVGEGVTDGERRVRAVRVVRVVRVRFLRLMGGGLCPRVHEAVGVGLWKRARRPCVSMAVLWRLRGSGEVWRDGL